MRISLTSPFLIRVILLLLMAFISLPLFANDIEEGKKSYRKQDYQAALLSWRQAAENDNAEAQWLLGALLFNGHGVLQDKAAAYSWLTLAGEKNFQQAIIDRTDITKMLSTEDIAIAETLTKRFKERLLAKKAISIQEQEAYHWFHKAAEKGDPLAQYKVGKMLLTGQGVQQDKIAAYAWFTLANEQQQPEALMAQAQLKTQLNADDINTANALSQANRRQESRGNKYSKSPSLKTGSELAQTKDNLSEQVNYRVQIGAFTSKAQATQALTKLTKKLPAITSKYDSIVTAPDNTNKQKIHRLQLGNFIKREDATELCVQLLNNKQSCFVTKVKN